MKALRSLFLDGLLVAIPLALIAALAVYVIEFFKTVVGPLVDLLPVDSVLGVGLLTICAVLALVLVILLFGLIVRWRARGLVDWFERKVLNRISAYTMIKRISENVVAPDNEDMAVLVDVHGSGVRALGLPMEDLGEHAMSVFVPDAPSATTGRVYVVPKERVEVLPVTVLQAIDVLGRRGLGLAELHAGNAS